MNQNSWLLTCSNCGGSVVATIVLPTSAKSIALIGSCAHCHHVGDTATVVFEYYPNRVTYEEWLSLMEIENLPVLRHKEADNG